MRPPSAFPFSPSRNLGRVTARPGDGEGKGFPSSDSSVPPCATLRDTETVRAKDRAGVDGAAEMSACLGFVARRRAQRTEPRAPGA